MRNVLYVSQPLDVNCGIGLIGKLYGDCLDIDIRNNYSVLYSNNVEEILSVAKNADCVIYNYHPQSTPYIRRFQLDIPQIILFHEIGYQYEIDRHAVNNIGGFDYVITTNPKLTARGNVFVINRLLPNVDTNEYIGGDVPVIGFQGFAIHHKGIERIVPLVENEFESSVINLRIPDCYYADRDNSFRTRILKTCYSQVKKDTKIVVNTDLVTTDQIIKLISQNTLNIYPSHTSSDIAGCSSSIDYAIAAKRPIAVTKAPQMRMLHGLIPSVCIEDSSLKEIISYGIEPYKHLIELGSQENIRTEISSVLDKIGV